MERLICYLVEAQVKCLWLVKLSVQLVQEKVDQSFFIWRPSDVIAWEIDVINILALLEKVSQGFKTLGCQLVINYLQLLQQMKVL